MDFNVFYCILIQFNEVLMDFAVFYCILLYFRSLRIPRTFEGRVEQFTTIYHYLPLFTTWKQSQNKDFAQQSIGFRPLKASFLTPTVSR